MTATTMTNVSNGQRSAHGASIRRERIKYRTGKLKAAIMEASEMYRPMTATAIHSPNAPNAG